MPSQKPIFESQHQLPAKFKRTKLGIVQNFRPKIVQEPLRPAKPKAKTAPYFLAGLELQSVVGLAVDSAEVPQVCELDCAAHDAGALVASKCAVLMIKY